ncbi:MAG: 4Fe-4S binding protein [Candidatus Cloacimonetes bacterium]|nr:4Fe-4S binding protein [Candidatus Cloacimonadota bacterium]
MGDVSNSPGGKIVFTILTSCHDCSQCINRCPNGAISDIGPRKVIDYDLCDACGNCEPYCPWNLIRLWVAAYD